MMALLLLVAQVWAQDLLLQQLFAGLSVVAPDLAPSTAPGHGPAPAPQVWAKDLLFQRLFGKPDAANDLDDTAGAGSAGEGSSLVGVMVSRTGAPGVGSGVRFAQGLAIVLALIACRGLPPA